MLLQGTNSFKIEIIEKAFTNSKISLEGLEDQKFIIENIDKMGGLDSIDLQFDLSLARGLSYYTGTIFELVISNFPEIGSIGGGGRYDNLTESFGNKKSQWSGNFYWI